VRCARVAIVLALVARVLRLTKRAGPGTPVGPDALSAPVLTSYRLVAGADGLFVSSGGAVAWLDVAHGRWATLPTPPVALYPFVWTGRRLDGWGTDGHLYELG